MLNFFNVSKIYIKNKDEKFYALNNFSYTFDKKGMYCILGKSGSGKTTIANLGALLDSPSEGYVSYNHQNLSKLKAKEINHYRSKIVSCVFQHYNLLPDLSVIDNIIVPRLALQEDEKVARADAEELLAKLDFNNDFKDKLCKDLSGGEAQRVAILRSIINSPEVIIADEPTGALDEANSIAVMDILKKISKKKTVIVITHNEKLALEYADELLYLNDGKLEKTRVLKKRNASPEIDIKSNNKLGKHKKWITKFAINRLKKNKNKNILSCLSTCIGITSVFLIIGFVKGSNNVVDTKCQERFDYGVGEISKTEHIKIDNSVLNLTKSTRLSKDEITVYDDYYDFIDCDINFDALFSNHVFKIDGKEIKDANLIFIYRYDDTYCDKKLLYKGDLPNENGVIVNQTCEKLLKSKYGLSNVLGKSINLTTYYDVVNVDGEQELHDEFKLNNSFNITGCSKEFSFLATPKIYISYSYIKNILQSMVLDNLSSLMESEITWYNYIKDISDSDNITSYSHKVFVKNNEFEKFNSLIEHYKNNEKIDITSDAYLATTTFQSLIDSVKIGLYIFSGIAILGTLLIIGLNAFSSYAFERKKSAIYFAFGVSKDQLFNVFIIESLIVTTLAFMLSIILSFGLEKLINFIVNKYFFISNVITIPFTTYNNIPFFLFFAVLIFALTACIISTYLPLAFSKKINLKKELTSE